jgi:uncharacterized repeat protein (TIGR02543 family)
MFMIRKQSFPVIFTVFLMVCSTVLGCAAGTSQPVKVSHTITFNANGGTGTMASQTMEEGESAALNANSFSRPGYTFTGWATNETAVTAFYGDKVVYTMGKADLTLYAVWTEAKKAFSLVSGQTGSGYITLKTTDTWSFSANAGDYIWVTAGDPGATDFDPALSLVSPDGANLISNSGDYGCVVYATAPKTGTYTVKVSDYGSDAPGNYTVSLVVSGVNLAITAGDEGGSIASGATAKGTIGYGDSDGWTISANAGDYIWVTAGDPDGKALDPALTLVAPDGTMLQSNSGAYGCVVFATAPKTGIYTILVYDHGQNNSGDYALSPIVTGGSLAITAGDEGGPIASGTTAKGIIGYGDSDGWSFTAAAGAAITVTVTDSGPTDYDPGLTVLAPDGTMIGSNSGSSSCQVYGTAKLGGTFTIIVSDSGQNNSGAYTLSLVIK